MDNVNNRLSVLKNHLRAQHPDSDNSEHLKAKECAAASTKPKLLVDPKPSVIPKRR